MMARLSAALGLATERFADELRMVVAGMALALVLAAGLFVGTRVWSTYGLETRVSLLELRLQQNAEDDAAFKRELRTELEALRASLYGPESPQRRRTMVERWSRNRDQELRARIAAIEKRLYRLER